MHLGEYQRRANGTDQSPSDGDCEDPRVPRHQDVVPLLGLVGEVGGLLGEYKKLLRDGHIHRRFADEVAEELGDILWYVANVAEKFGLQLEDIASTNLAKVEDRWLTTDQARKLFDDEQPENQRLPRRFRFRFEQNADSSGVVRVQMHDDSMCPTPTGNPLTDNADEDDGYRFHDIMHLTFAAKLGWSPVLRKLLRDAGRLKNRTPESVDNAEDGGRAQVIEEAIVAAAYAYATDHDFLHDATAIDWQLLRYIQRMTDKLEVKTRTTGEWNAALLCGIQAWRDLCQHGGGTVKGDLIVGEIHVTPRCPHAREP